MAVARSIDRYIEAADSVIKVVGSMKGIALMGRQALAMVDPELVPAAYHEVYGRALTVLGDSPPAAPWKDIEKTLKRETGEPVGRTFADFDQAPAASASIGQVHRAVLEDGRGVAVKVQHPGVAEAVRADLQNIGLILRAVQLVAPGIDAGGLAAEARERIGEELDYEWEAQAQRRFARAYKNHPFIHVPNVVTHLCTTRVLVSDWVEGAGFDEVRALPASERDRFGEILFRFYIGSPHRVGALNGDPHPANLLLMADGRVAFLDYGSVRDVAPERLPAGPVLEVPGGWLSEEGGLALGREFMLDLVGKAADPGGELDDLIEQVSGLPPEDLMRLRVEAGLLATLGRLEATADWRGIGMEYWAGAEPSGALGRAERDFG